MGQHGDVALAEHGPGLLQHPGRGAGLRASEEVALAQLDAQVADGLEVVGRLQAFGHHGGAQCFGDAGERTHGLHFVGLPRHIAREVLVDLDVIRLQLGPQAQAGAAIAEIIERDLHAMGPQGPQRLDERRQVTHPFVLGQLDHHGGGRQAKAPQRGDAALQRFAMEHMHQRFRAQVHEELAG